MHDIYVENMKYNDNNSIIFLISFFSLQIKCRHYVKIIFYSNFIGK